MAWLISHYLHAYSCRIWLGEEGQNPQSKKLQSASFFLWASWVGRYSIKCQKVHVLCPQVTLPIGQMAFPYLFHLCILYWAMGSYIKWQTNVLEYYTWLYSCLCVWMGGILAVKYFLLAKIARLLKEMAEFAKLSLQKKIWERVWKKSMFKHWQVWNIQECFFVNIILSEQN